MHKECMPQDFRVTVYLSSVILDLCWHIREPSLSLPPLFMPLFDLIKELHSIYRHQSGFFWKVFPLIRTSALPLISSKMIHWTPRYSFPLFFKSAVNFLLSCPCQNFRAGILPLRTQRGVPVLRLSLLFSISAVPESLLLLPTVSACPCCTIWCPLDSVILDHILGRIWKKNAFVKHNLRLRSMLISSRKDFSLVPCSASGGDGKDPGLEHL